MSHERRTSNPRAIGLAAVHGLLAMLFAFVLPFVCWGVWAMPGHAHGTAHFVFGLPPALYASLEATAHSPAQASVRQAFADSWCGSALVAPLAGVPVDEEAAASAASESSAGRSVPSTALSAMPLMAHALWTSVMSQPPSYCVAVAQDCPGSTDLSVPTPPPRALT